MAIDPRVRMMLDRKGIELVRARFTKEMAVTVDTDEAMKKEISFGDQNVSLNDLAEWLAAKQFSLDKGNWHCSDRGGGSCFPDYLGCCSCVGFPDSVGMEGAGASRIVAPSHTSYRLARN